jgi:hypothetical protein
MRMVLTNPRQRAGYAGNADVAHRCDDSSFRPRRKIDRRHFMIVEPGTKIEGAAGAGKV